MPKRRCSDVHSVLQHLEFWNSSSRWTIKGSTRVGFPRHDRNTGSNPTADHDIYEPSGLKLNKPGHSTFGELSLRMWYEEPDHSLWLCNHCYCSRLACNIRRLCGEVGWLSRCSHIRPCCLPFWLRKDKTASRLGELS